MKHIFLCIALICTLYLTSCSKEDGDWEPMKWKTTATTAKDGYIYVDSDGGTFVFQCRNYSRPWMADVVQTEDEKSVRYNPPETDGKTDFKKIETTWLTSACENNTVTVKIQPTTAPHYRTMHVTVTAGDIFFTFKFKQYGLCTNQ